MHIDNACWMQIVSVVDISAQCIALATGLGQLYYTGKKKTVGWVIGLAGQPFWMIFEIIHYSWPLMILTVVFTAQTYKNYRQWKQFDERQESMEQRKICCACGQSLSQCTANADGRSA